MMREANFSDIFYTDFAYFVVEYVRQEVTAPQEIADDVFPELLEEKNVNSVYERIAKPCERTLLHSFATNLINYANSYVIRKAAELECNSFLTLISQANLPVPPWLNAHEVENHKYELIALCETAVEIILPSAFHILFSDRNILFNFQRRVATYIRTLQAHQHPNILRSNGIVKRLVYQPRWLSKAIFFRDQGRCQLCFRDISGLSSSNVQIHFDHMVPLAVGGSNDPTNFQLACNFCNTSKGKKELILPARFESYW